MADTWWNIYPIHYTGDGIPSDSVFCHFLIPQYNMHGAYYIANRTVRSAPTAPRSCAKAAKAVNYYFYHGSIGLYSYYDEGQGSYCPQDYIAYTITTGVGTTDMNFNKLAKFEGAAGYHSSYYFGCVGIAWLAYRAIILMRSFVSCSQFAHRLDALHEPISLASSIVYMQQASRISPHTSTNRHRVALLYLLVEGLMTDLFLLIAFEGYAAKLQYFSLGYNIAGLLSMLFEIVETTSLLRPKTLLVIKRLLFNTETAFWGELLFAIAMQHYLSALNRSSLQRSIHVAEVVSHYLLGVTSHGIVVLGQTACILTARVTGTLFFVMWRFGSLHMLVDPCCVDSTMGYRYKLAKLNGYVYHNARLCYTREALKAHGLLRMFDVDGNEFLVYHRIHWFHATEEDLAILGKLSGEQLEACQETSYSGPVSVCDRMIGGASAAEMAERTSNDHDHDLESSELIDRASRSSDDGWDGLRSEPLEVERSKPYLAFLCAIGASFCS